MYSSTEHRYQTCKRGGELTSRFAENATCHNLSIINFEVSILLIDFPIIVITCHYLWFTYTQRWSKQEKAFKNLSLISFHHGWRILLIHFHVSTFLYDFKNYLLFLLQITSLCYFLLESLIIFKIIIKYIKVINSVHKP